MRTITLPNEALLPEIVALLADGKRVTLKVKGNSMRPFIIGGRDSVALQKEEKYRSGDVVLAELSQDRFVLHRIIKIKGNAVVLMGDDNLAGTEKCWLSAVHGRVVFIIRGGRQVKCGSGCIWRRLLPVRKYLLAICRRI